MSKDQFRQILQLSKFKIPNEMKKDINQGILNRDSLN